MPENKLSRMGLALSLRWSEESFISSSAAVKISALHPRVEASAIEGMAYDSLFKQLCAEQVLRTPEGRQVLAPFAFVSSLAGALLVVEILRHKAGLANTNYWQVNPWGAPIGRLRTLRPRFPTCEFCSRPHFQAVVDNLWRTSAAKIEILS